MTLGAFPRTHVEHCMGTVFSFSIAPPGVDEHALNTALDWLHRMDAMFSTYRADSEISRLRDGTLRLTSASAEVQAALDACEYFAAITDGFFNAYPDGQLDPSGYVKGWSIQRLGDMLTEAGSSNHCVNGGGDVFAVGRPTGDHGWRVGISDPHDSQKLLATTEAAGPFGVATSGVAERGAHILDPHTHQPAIGLAAVTVVAESLVTADVFATAAIAMGPERAPRWLAEHSDVQALLVYPDGHTEQIGTQPRP